MYDIVIVGSGPAGLTAAVYGLRSGKSVLVIEKNGFGGQSAYSPKGENIPGTIQISGAEFADQLLEQAINLGAILEPETVTGIEKNAEGFLVHTEEGGDFEGINAYLPRTGYEKDEVFEYNEDTRKLICNLWSKVKIAASNAG